MGLARSIRGALDMTELIGQPHRRIVPRVGPIVAVPAIGLIVLVDRVELRLRGRAEVVCAVLVADVRCCGWVVLVACGLAVAGQHARAPLRPLHVRAVLPLQLVDFVLLFLWVVLVGIACSSVFELVFAVLLLIGRQYPWRRDLFAAEMPGRIDRGGVAADSEALRATKLSVAAYILLTRHTVRWLSRILLPGGVLLRQRVASHHVGDVLSLLLAAV